MKTWKRFLLPVLESLEFGSQVIRYALIFVSAFFRQRASWGCEMVAIRSLLETGLEPHLLELELTESVLMQHPESTVSVLRALKSIGVRLAVDDFGTGYSSLSYLRRFPIDVLKLDQSFVHDITGPETKDAAIVSAVITMGKSLKQRVIAEGIETPEQLAFLRTHRCDEGQGYYFSPPHNCRAVCQIPWYRHGGKR